MINIAQASNPLLLVLNFDSTQDSRTFGSVHIFRFAPDCHTPHVARGGIINPDSMTGYLVKVPEAAEIARISVTE